MNFFVFEDLEHAAKVKIHKKNCRYISNKSTVSTRWYSFIDIDGAESKAKELSNQYKKGWKFAQCCFKQD